MVKTLNVTLDDSDHERARDVKEELDLTWAEFIVEAAAALETREQDDIAPSGSSAPADRDTTDGTASERGVSRATSIDDLFTTWDPGWTSNVSTRYEVGRTALEWLRDRDQPASGSDFRDALLPEHEVAGQSPDTWWRKTVRPWLRKAVEHGLVAYREGYHDYRWTGAGEQ